MGTVVETKSNLERPWTAPIDSDHDQVVHTRVQYRLGDEGEVHRLAGPGLDVADLGAAGGSRSDEVEFVVGGRNVNLCASSHGCSPSVRSSEGTTTIPTLSPG